MTAGLMRSIAPAISSTSLGTREVAQVHARMYGCQNASYTHGHVRCIGPCALAGIAAHKAGLSLHDCH